MEHLTLVQCTEKLCSGISQDPLRVCLKLFENGLVADAQIRECQLESKDRYVKASVLVDVVTQKIGSFPSCFETFLTILEEFPWLREEVKYVRGKHKTNMANTADHQVRSK